jgi:hypothetical protein
MKKQWIGILIVGMTLGTAWAIRGQFGHEQGAAWAGGIGALALVLVSKRKDWYSKMLTVALSSAAGWGAGGMISYGIVVGYGRSDNFPNAFYGLLMLFVIGGLFGLLGGGLTGLTLESSERKKIKWGWLLAEMTAGGVISYYLLISQLEILMTPPRSEAWAVCLGAGMAMIWHMARNKFNSALRVALITTLGAGFGFAFGNFLQILGNVLEIKFNMWNVMEYSIGFFGGSSLAYGVFSTVWPEESSAPERWESGAALFLLFVFIPIVIFSQSLGYNKLLEKFSNAGNPETTALLSSLAAALVFISVAAIVFFRLKREGNRFERQDVLLLLLVWFAAYIVVSYLVTGAFTGRFLLNHHLYWVNFIIILFLAGRQFPVFFENQQSSLNRKQLLLSLTGILITIVVFAIIAINIHGVMPGSHDRFQLSQYHEDKPFVQDFSIKYLAGDENIELYSVASDRNGYIQVFSSEGLLRPAGGQHLFPGRLVRDTQYRPTSDKKIAGINKYRDHLVYVDDSAVLSNAWAGNLFSRHTLAGARIFKGGEDFTFLISDGKKLILLKDSEYLWEGDYSEEIRDIKYDDSRNEFWILGKETISVFSPARKEVKMVMTGSNFSCIEVASGKLIAGTSDGYLEIDPVMGKPATDVKRKLPWTELTVINEIYGDLWFGSSRGAFKLRRDGQFDYYASERWLPSDSVADITGGSDNSVLILTDKGLAKILFKEMTLLDKAMFFEKQVRERHIRHGFNATVTGIENGDVTTGRLEDSDNDGLWTSMYLAGQTFRYAVTGEEEALQNVRESLDAMERLYTVNPVPGFPARSFERRGYKYEEKPWRRAEDPEWDWKSTTSSDEAIGHIFAFAAIAELITVPDIREKAILLIDTLMSHVVKNDFYLIDWNGEPTLWGKWNPDYVNARPKIVGDRKLNSSNIIGMLQTAYHFTGKQKYRDAAFYLMNEHGYFENLIRPISEIGTAPAEADTWSRMLSESWNHSDDEMYYCGYWGLYRYAFNDTLKIKYREAIIDHWESERPEKEGLWNIMTALANTNDIDLEEAIWYLQEYPLDLTDWTVTNSHRKDIELIEPGFRGQTTKEVLPPDEVPVARHNANRFDLDGKGGGRSEYSAGDIWLLPYWAGRYLGVIK